MTQDELKKRLQAIQGLLRSHHNADPDTLRNLFRVVCGCVDSVVDGTVTCSRPEGTPPWVMSCPHDTDAAKTDEARVAEFLQHHESHLNCPLEQDDKKVLWLKNGLSLVCEYTDGERRFDWKVQLRVTMNGEAVRCLAWMHGSGLCDSWFDICSLPKVASARAWQATVWKEAKVMMQTGHGEWKECGKLTFPEW